MHGFGDLVVLINPAFEAARFAPLSDMANEQEGYPPSQLPVLAILTSETDNATKRAFPLGRWFSTFFEEHRIVQRADPVTGKSKSIDQKQANITAVGHFAPYQTHQLRPLPPWLPRPEFKSELGFFVETSNKWDDDQPGKTIEFNDTLLTRSEDTVGRNPYLVIQVDQELIRDHNDIDDTRIASFLSQLVLIAAQEPSKNERKINREALQKIISY